MFKRNLVFAALCLAAGSAVFGQPGTGYVFQIPGAGTTNAQIVGYPYSSSPLSPTINTLGPNGTTQIVAKPDGTGYYVLGTTLQIADPTFTTFTTINGISTTPASVTPSPDGNYAVIGASAAYIISASTAQILATIPTNGTVVGAAISRDSSTAYILTNTVTASSVTQVQIPSGKVVGSPLVLGGNATQIAISPLGLLYVGAANRLYEINPTTLAITSSGTIQFNATPGPLHFTPDGTTVYFANITANITGGSIIQITLATYAVAKWPNLIGGSNTPIDDVLVAGNGRIFAISYANTTLYDVNTSPLSMQVSALNSLFNATSVLGAAISSEIPSLYLYALVSTNSGDTMYRVTLANNQTTIPVNATLQGGTLQFVAVPPQSGPASFLQYNTNQTVAQGATSLPLIARVLDLSGRPIFNQPVSFTAPSGSGFSFSNPTPTTNADGYVQTTVIAPASQGTYTITITAGTANASYTITVPGVGGGSGGGGGTINQVTIVSGNGQLIQAGSTTYLTGSSLTIKVTDINGQPLQGVAANFAVTSGTGYIANPSVVTDANGLAMTDFVAAAPGAGQDFETDTVIATTAYGLVTFTETEFAAIVAGSSFPAYPPAIKLLAPTDSVVTVAEGSVAVNAVTASITAQSIPQVAQNIPGVAIAIIDPTTPYPYSASTHASCKNGSTLSDAATGVAHCDIVALCGAGGTSAIGNWPVGYQVGGLVFFPGFVNVTQGTGQLLAIVSGNNQSGPAGQTLPFPLVAAVTDGCNNPIPGTAVTWTVKSGAAKLSNVVSTSVGGGRVSANVTFGAAPGTVVVTASLGTTAVATFTLTSQPVLSGMTIVSGNNQTTTINTAFSPLTVQVNDVNNNPISGVTVAFVVTSGNVAINPTTAVTNSQGQASTTATAAQTAGVSTVTASYSSASVVFNLTAVPLGPQVTAGNFQNAASFQSGLVPCGLATATGSGIAPGITGTISGASFFGPLPYTLNGLSVSINGIPAPIYQLSNTNGKEQVTFQTPCEASVTSNGTAVLQLSGGATTVTGIQILQAQPGIFYYLSNGIAYGDVISGDDGSYVSPTNPAKRGHTYYLVATGLGQVTPATATNSVGINGQTVAAQVIVGVDNLGVPVTTAYYQPGAIGVYVVGFTIPLTNPAGTNQPLALGMVVNGNTIFANTVYIPVVQ
ncbi:MAG TPA: Ig-like domain-containing protein [Bryobacteraceae bacterium]|nr:Ig-like domain-containing protein [Bryobacteraceae bacterium]